MARGPLPAAGARRKPEISACSTRTEPPRAPPLLLPPPRPPPLSACHRFGAHPLPRSWAISAKQQWCDFLPEAINEYGLEYYNTTIDPYCKRQGSKKPQAGAGAQRGEPGRHRWR